MIARRSLTSSDGAGVRGHAHNDERPLCGAEEAEGSDTYFRCNHWLYTAPAHTANNKQCVTHQYSDTLTS